MIVKRNDIKIMNILYGGLLEHPLIVLSLSSERSASEKETVELIIETRSTFLPYLERSFTGIVPYQLKKIQKQKIISADHTITNTTASTISILAGSSYSREATNHVGRVLSCFLADF